VIEPEREVGQVEGRCDVPLSESLIVLSKSNIELRGEVGQLPALRCLFACGVHGSGIGIDAMSASNDD
jgi:hypothetical protein